MPVERHDYAYPFRIDQASREAARAGYETHVREMVIQLLLTSPGERADLPEFGCGLRRLLFAPNSVALATTTELLVRQALARWLSSVLSTQKVTVSTTDDESGLVVQIEYVLVSDGRTSSAEVRVS